MITIMMDRGIVCAAADERALVRNVNAFLKSCDFRPMYKWPRDGIQPPDRTFRIPYVYLQFLKDHPRWLFDLTPNVDLDGRARFPDDLDCGWTMFTNKVHPNMNSPEDDASLDDFFERLAAGTGFPTRVLHVYEQPLKERL
jgi:hypothetical protein